jgi:TRAP-type C4-dicarboxylate transport system permease small subunit
MKSLYQLGQWLAVLFLTLLVLLTVADVSLRWAFNKPIWGAAEMGDVLLALIISSGFFVVNNNRGHIMVDLFHGALRRWLGKAYDGFVSALELIGTLLYAGIIGLFAYEALESNETTVVLDLPVGIVFSVVCALILLSAVLIVKPYLKGRDSA